MGRLGGDLLRLLAQSGLQMGAHLGMGYLAKGWEEQAKERLLGLKTGLEAASVEQDPEKQQQILRPLAERLQLPSVTETGFVERDENPTLSNLGRRTNLTYPEGRYEPATISRLVAPVPSLEGLKAKMIQGLPPDELKSVINPKGEAIQAARENLIASLALRSQEGEANRLSRESIAEQGRLLQEGMRRDNLDLRRQMHQDKMESQRLGFNLIAKKAGDASLGRASSEINKAWDDYDRAARDRDPARMTTAAERYNELIKAVETKSPDLVGHFSPLTPEIVQTWTEWMTGQPGTKLTGKYNLNPKGPASTTSGERQYMLPKGGVMVPVDKNTYDAYVTKYGRPPQ